MSEVPLYSSTVDAGVHMARYLLSLFEPRDFDERSVQVLLEWLAIKMECPITRRHCGKSATPPCSQQTALNNFSHGLAMTSPSDIFQGTKVERAGLDCVDSTGEQKPVRGQHRAPQGQRRVRPRPHFSSSLLSCQVLEGP